MQPIEIIDLDSDNESTSDVIMMPIPSPPTFIIEDSADEDDKNNTYIILEHEENALDSTDEQMPSTSSRFIKRQQIIAQSREIVEYSLRSTTPCSTQSSDDFIGQNDVEDIDSYSQRAKRLRKCRASSSHDNCIIPSSDEESEDNDVDDENKILRIARGPIVETCKLRKRSTTLTPDYVVTISDSSDSDDTQNIKISPSSSKAENTRLKTVKSHQKSYDDNPIEIPHNGIGLNLMYEPCQEYNFDLNECTPLDHREMGSTELQDTHTSAKRVKRLCKRLSKCFAKRLSKRLYERLSKRISMASPANQQTTESTQDAPNQLNTMIKKSTAVEHSEMVLDSDSNYSFSEHFDVPLKAVDAENSTEDIQVDKPYEEESTLSNNSRPKPRAMEALPDFIPLIDSTGEDTVEDNDDDETSLGGISRRFVAAETHQEMHDDTTSKTPTEPPLVLDSDSNYSFSRPKPRPLGPLPDYIPLIDSTGEDTVEDNDDDETSLGGISRRSVAAETDEEMDDEHNARQQRPLSELLCEAKIYLDQQRRTAIEINESANNQKYLQLLKRKRNSCATPLMDKSSDKVSTTTDSNELPSTFWSRESMRYLVDSLRIASGRRDVVEKLKLVQNNAKNGQLSYNDYLAVIKLHTALCGK